MARNRDVVPGGKLWLLRTRLGRTSNLLRADDWDDMSAQETKLPGSPSELFAIPMALRHRRGHLSGSPCLIFRDFPGSAQLRAGAISGLSQIGASVTLIGTSWTRIDLWRGRAGVKGPEPAGRQAGVDLAPAATAAIGMDSSQEGAPVAARRGVARD